MTQSDMTKILIFYGPILLLVTIGLSIALRSGVMRMTSGAGVRRLAMNLSNAIAVTAIWLVAVAAVAQLIGVHFQVR